MTTNKTIKAIRSWATTIFGILLLLTSATFLVLDIMKVYDFSVMEMILVALFGWVFLFSKNDIIQALFMQKFNLKKDKE
jgi:hypothetical protein